MFARPIRAAARYAVLIIGIAAVSTLAAQSSSAGWNPQEILKAEGFVKPPADVEKLIVTPRTDISFTSPSPDRSWFLRAAGMDRGDILAYGKPHIYLGGVQVDTAANRARSVTTSTKSALTLINPLTGATKPLEVPKGASVTGQAWSPNGTQVAYIASFANASYAYVADVATGKSVQVSKSPLLATLVTSIEFTADGKSLIVVLVPEGRGAPPTHGTGGIEDGPTVRLTNSRAVPQPVHASLLLDPHEKAQLKYYTTGQLALLDLKTKLVKKIGEPRMIRAVDASSDAAYFRVTQMTEPFSYLVPASSFGSVQELWNANGTVITKLATTALREGAVDDGDAPAGFGRGGAQPATDTSKRNINWNPVGPGLVYVQSVFAGNGSGAVAPAGRGGRGGAGGRAGAAPARAQATSVRYLSWLPPFGAADTQVIYEGGPALGTIAYSADGKTMFVADSGSVFAIRTAEPTKRFNLGRGVTLAAGSGGGRGGGGSGGGGGASAGGADTSAAGGALQTRRGANGQSFVVVGTDGKSVALTGTRTPGANWSTQAPRPWLDKLDFESGQRTRVFDSPADGYDEFVTPLNDNYSQFLYTHESPTTIPDVWLKDVTANTTKKITANVDVGPELTGAIVKRFQVSRPRDGNKMWVDVTLPKDWRPGTRLPGIIWFYPREYTTQAEYERSRFTVNINRFPEVPSARPASSTKIWVSQGYALIEPDIPIWGDSGRMNDNYTRDLRENLDAVLDAVVEAGYVDRDRMGIGGHSYGAFGTMNAISLVPYFKGAIAGDGMYNRSLTPFGFQSERRSFFQAQDTYLDMSPFFRADKIVTPILMYHAWEDQNAGTAPLSATRMMAALQGLGKNAALYMYPYEDHSVATYASDLDLWARWFAWFDLHVKNAPATKKPIP